MTDHRAVNFFLRATKSWARRRTSCQPFPTPIHQVHQPLSACIWTGIDLRFRCKTGYCVCRRAVDVSHEPWYRNSLGLCPGSSVGITRCSAAIRKHLSKYFSCMRSARSTNHNMDLLMLYGLSSGYQDSIGDTTETPNILGDLHRGIGIRSLVFVLAC